MIPVGIPVTPTGPVVGADQVYYGDEGYPWTYVDCAGTPFDWVYTYTIASTCPCGGDPPNDGSTVAVISDAQVIPTPPSGYDSCGNPITPTGPVIGADPACAGDKTYTWTYVDCAGNSAN